MSRNSQWRSSLRKGFAKKFYSIPRKIPVLDSTFGKVAERPATLLKRDPKVCIK